MAGCLIWDVIVKKCLAVSFRVVFIWVFLVTLALGKLLITKVHPPYPGDTV